MEERSPPLGDQDVRKVVRLLGEVVAAPGVIHEKRFLPMEGLYRIIGGSARV